MRTIKELLQVMRDNQHLFSSGLCNLAIKMRLYDLISFEERDYMLSYIETNPPAICISRYFYWPIQKWPPRLAWINEQIEKLEQEEKQ